MVERRGERLEAKSGKGKGWRQGEAGTWNQRWNVLGKETEKESSNKHKPKAPLCFIIHMPFCVLHFCRQIC